MREQELTNLINKVVGVKGFAKIPSYWLKKIFYDLINWCKDYVKDSFNNIENFIKDRVEEQVVTSYQTYKSEEQNLGRELYFKYKCHEIFLYTTYTNAIFDTWRGGYGGGKLIYHFQKGITSFTLPEGTLWESGTPQVIDPNKYYTLTVVCHKNTLRASLLEYS